MSKSQFSLIGRGEFTAASTAGFAGISLEAGQSQASLNDRSSAPRRVIIDTDPGVDDAMALLFAMRSPELKIEAVTAVAGNVPLDLTLSNALRMVEIAGRTDIPVAAGARGPLKRKLVTSSFAHGTNGLGDLEFPAPKTKAARETATGIIHRLVSAHPGEVSIIPVGPLTNIAAALQAHPTLAKEIREIVLMGGSLSGGNMTPAAEFNMYVDPDAASIVFSSGIPLTMVGLDVTSKCVVTEDHVKALESGNDAVSQAAARITRNALERSKEADWGLPVLHDPLAVATFMDKTLVRLRDYFVAVETEGRLTAGETLGYDRAPVRPSAPLAGDAAASEDAGAAYIPNAKVAVEVDVSRFFQLLIGRLTGKPPA